MSSSNIASVLKILNECNVCCIFGHENPDADCLASQSVLASWLSRTGKTAHKCSVGPWERPEISEWQSSFESTIPQFDAEEHVLKIFVDCSSPERTGYPSIAFPAGPSLVIDHHSAGSDFGTIRYIDTSSPSTTLLVQRIMSAANTVPTLEEANLLFLGFCTDTGFFRFLKAGNGEPFREIAQLVEIGASPAETYRLLSGGRSLGTRHLLGRALQRVELYFDGRAAITWETWKDWQELGRERDKDMLYQLLTSITGVEAVVLIREQIDGTCSLGLRSTGSLDVGSIAGFFGGGGHNNAAGCTITGDRSDVLEQVLKILADRLEGTSKNV